LSLISLISNFVSILVLMDLCIKTQPSYRKQNMEVSFNPCFNGSMYKNPLSEARNGRNDSVSILVLMDLCIKTMSLTFTETMHYSFNPCFNGSMYKNKIRRIRGIRNIIVSILVLMDLCIKTKQDILECWNRARSFNPCFNGSMYKNLWLYSLDMNHWRFQSLF